MEEQTTLLKGHTTPRIEPSAQSRANLPILLAFRRAWHAVASLPKAWKGTRARIPCIRRSVLDEPRPPIWSNIAYAASQWRKFLNVACLGLRRTGQLAHARLSSEPIVITASRKLARCRTNCLFMPGCLYRLRSDLPSLSRLSALSLRSLYRRVLR
jgi:hypothetical protein